MALDLLEQVGTLERTDDGRGFALTDERLSMVDEFVIK